MLRASVCLSVCVSVREHILKTTRPDFTKFSMLVARGRDSTLLWWWRCNMLRTSGFMDDVMLVRNRPGKGDGTAEPGRLLKVTH